MDELVRRWAHGWTLCRGLAAPLDRPAALEVTLGLPGRDREVFTLTDNAETVNDLAITTAKGENPGEGTREGEVVWLTVTTNQPQATAAVLEQAGLKLLDEPCLLMTIDLTEHPDKAAPPGTGWRPRATGHWSTRRSSTPKATSRPAEWLPSSARMPSCTTSTPTRPIAVAGWAVW